VRYHFLKKVRKKLNENEPKETVELESIPAIENVWNRLGVELHACSLSYSGGRGRRIMSSRLVQTKLVQDPISKTKYKVKGRGHGSNGRAFP
jgi:hypothetical protein